MKRLYNFLIKIGAIEIDNEPRLYALKIGNRFYTGKVQFGEVPATTTDSKYAFRMTLEDAILKLRSDKMLAGFDVELVGARP